MIGDRTASAAAARARLDTSLSELLSTASIDVPDVVYVDPFALLQRCPARLVNPAQDYEERTVTVRRRLGLLALRHAWADHGDRHLGGPPGDLGEAVGAVLADRQEWPAGLADWFASLGRAGQASVSAAVLTWCADVVRLLVSNGAGGEALAMVRWADPFRAPRVDRRVSAVGSTVVRLRAPVDAVLRRPGMPERLLVVSDATPSPGDRLRAGLVALVHAVGSGRAPGGVSVGSPSGGTIERVVIDAALLDLAVDRVVEVVGHLVDPEHAPAAPGHWCGHCHLRDACEPGAAHLAGDRRLA